MGSPALFPGYPPLAGVPANLSRVTRSTGQVQRSTVETAMSFAGSEGALQLEEAVVQDAVDEQPLQSIASHQ